MWETCLKTVILLQYKPWLLGTMTIMLYYRHLKAPEKEQEQFSSRTAELTFHKYVLLSENDMRLTSAIVMQSS